MSTINYRIYPRPSEWA